MLQHEAPNFVKVGVLLGKPTPVDATRPNTMERATPRFPGVNGESSPADYPLYWAFKVCRVCGRHFEGWSLTPQYDDDEALNGWCGCARATSAGYGQWQWSNRPKLARSAPTRHQRDPLDD